MQNLLVYSSKEHKSFREEWLPHRDSNEFWSFYAVLMEQQGEGGSLYGLNLSIRHLQSPFDAFTEVFLSFSDLTKGGTFQKQYLLPHLHRGKQEECIFDENSFFCGEKIQLLWEKHCLALRIQEEGFSLDLCAEQGMETQWAGGGGLTLLPGPKFSSTLHCGCMPGMKCFAKLMQGEDGDPLRLDGKASFERMWGVYPVYSAKAHWEKFHLFLDDGRELVILDLPYGRTSWAFLLDEQLGLQPISAHTLIAMDALEVDEWRFGSGWRLELPEEAPMCLVVLEKEQSLMPTPRLNLGAYDEQNNQLGVGFGELMPGARNELSTVSLRTYLTYFRKAEVEIL